MDELGDVLVSREAGDDDDADLSRRVSQTGDLRFGALGDRQFSRGEARPSLQSGGRPEAGRDLIRGRRHRAFAPRPEPRIDRVRFTRPRRGGRNWIAWCIRVHAFVIAGRRGFMGSVLAGTARRGNWQNGARRRRDLTHSTGWIAMRQPTRRGRCAAAAIARSARRSPLSAPGRWRAPKEVLRRGRRPSPATGSWLGLGSAAARNRGVRRGIAIDAMARI
jgi:hypothetical protein